MPRLCQTSTPARALHTRYGFPSIGGGPPAIFQLNYQQDIFNPLLKAQQRSAEQHAKSMKIEIDRTRDDVIVRTATAYLELAKVRHSLELMRVEQVSAEKIARVTRDRVAANQELSIEETRSQLERLLASRNASSSWKGAMPSSPNSFAISPEFRIHSRLKWRLRAEPSFATDAQANELANMALQSDRGIQEAQNDREAQHNFAWRKAELLAHALGCRPVQRSQQVQQLRQVLSGIPGKQSKRRSADQHSDFFRRGPARTSPSRKASSKNRK